MINLNHDGLFIGNFTNGKTQNVECKLGKKLYYVDIDKNSCNTTLDFYRKLGERDKFSKYDKEANRVSVTVKNSAVLFREFFENISEIEKAQRIMNKYVQELV